MPAGSKDSTVKRNIFAVVGVLVLAAIVSALWENSDRKTTGAGAFEEELAECQDFIWQMNQQPEGLEFIGKIWHRVADDTLEIGGALTSPDMAGRPEGFNYTCKIRNGRIVQGDVGK